MDKEKGMRLYQGQQEHLPAASIPVSERQKEVKEKYNEKGWGVGSEEEEEEIGQASRRVFQNLL